MNRTAVGLMVITLVALLSVIVMLAGTVRRQTANGRYAFALAERSNELYVFDQHTGTIYITSPELVHEYNGQAWTKLSIADGAPVLPFSRYLTEYSERRRRDAWFENQRRTMPEPDAAMKQSLSEP